MAEVIDGQERACSTCRFWSDLVADMPTGGPLLALCLGPGEPSEMRPGTHHCGTWMDAPFGAIDEPCDEASPYSS